MRFWTLLKRELGALYLSPIASAVGTLFLFFNGLLLGVLLLNYTGGMGAVPSRALYGGWMGSAFTWLFSFIMIPVITMRLFSEERRQGSLELLQTAPVGDGAIVLSKWLGAWIFFMSLWLPGLLIFAWLKTVAPLDWRSFAACLVMLALFSALWCAAGLLFSSFTAHMIIAALLTGVAMVGSLLLGFLGNLDPSTFSIGGGTGFGEALTQLFKLCNPLEGLDLYAKGIVDTRVAVFHLTLTALLLLVAQQRLAARRFRG